MDSDNDSYHFPKCQTHAYNTKTAYKVLLTKYSTEENNKHVICRPRSVRIGKNCALGLGYGPRPAAPGRAQDLWHSFSQYGPPGRQITYIHWSTFNPGLVLSRFPTSRPRSQLLSKIKLYKNSTGLTMGLSRETYFN